jgi:Ca2+-binding EF-hand superfamily protein
MSGNQDWVDVQIRAFTKWANSHLKAKGITLESIVTDLGDGVNLALLLESLSQEPIPFNKNARMRIQKIENVNYSLDFISSQGVRLVGIGAEEIVDLNAKMTLGLIWTVILRFVIAGLSEEGLSAKQGLLLWCQKKTEPYDNVDVQNFTFSFQDGLAFCALIHRHRPDLIDMDGRDSSDPHKNLNDAFDIAENELGITKLMDAEDIADVAKPDEKIVMTYVAQMYHCFSGMDKNEVAGRRVENFLAFQQQVHQLVTDYEERTRALIAASISKGEEIASSPVPSTYDDAISSIADFRNYRKGQRREFISEKDDLATLFSQINLKLRGAGLPLYVAPHGLSVSDTADHLDDLSQVEATRRTSLNNTLRDMQEQAQRNFADLADALAAKCAQFKERISNIDGDLQSQLQQLGSQQSEIDSGYADLPAIKDAEDHQEACGVEVNSYTDHTWDDLSFELDQINKICRQTGDIIRAQIASQRDEGLTAEQIQDFQESFNHFDENGSGSLSRLELNSCLASLGLVDVDFEGEDPKFTAIWDKLSGGRESVDFDTFALFMAENEADKLELGQLTESFRLISGGKDHVSRDDLTRAGVNQEVAEFITLALPETEQGYDYNSYLDSTFN